MDLISYPLNGITYGAEDVETYLCTRTSGVYSRDSNFSVSVSGPREITVSPGLAWINYDDFKGLSVCARKAGTLNVPDADDTLDRIDRVVLQFDVDANKTDLKIKTGTPSATPAAPDILQNHRVYELGLCEITVPAGSTVITAANILDTRADETVCGVMRDGVTGIPTEELLAQWQQTLAQQDAAGQAYLKDMKARADKIIRNYSGGYVGQYELILQPAGWKTAPGSTGYGYQYDAPLADVNTDHVPFAAVDLGSQDTAEACQMASACEAQDGYISFWAKSVPAAALVINVTLLGPSTTSSGGTGYDVATDEEVKDMLDRVYNN